MAPLREQLAPLSGTLLDPTETKISLTLDQAQTLIAAIERMLAKNATYAHLAVIEALARNRRLNAMETRNDLARLSHLVPQPLAGHIGDGVRRIDRAVENQAAGAFLGVPLDIKEDLIRSMVLSICASCRAVIDTQM